MGRRVTEYRAPRRLYPARVVHTGSRRWLSTQLRIGVPNVIEEHKDRGDAVLVGYFKILFDSVQEPVLSCL